MPFSTEFRDWPTSGKPTNVTKRPDGWIQYLNVGLSLLHHAMTSLPAVDISSHAIDVLKFHVSRLILRPKRPYSAFFSSPISS